jgi:hypothetical protein
LQTNGDSRFPNDVDMECPTIPVAYPSSSEALYLAE